MDRVASPSPAELRDLIRRGLPFVATGLIDEWAARSWGLDRLRADHGSLQLCVRVHPRGGGSVFEGECAYVKATLGEFCAWLDGDDLTAPPSPLNRFPRAEYVGYADYHDMSELFAEAPEALGAVDWARLLGGSRRDGAQSTMWLGSSGAHTPAHYDTYGLNLVAQCFGTKRWCLVPRGAPDAPLPSRVPYEESSVFAEEGAGALGDGALVIDLSAGEVLHVPRHYWHQVDTVSEAALSINTWLDSEQDADERVREALVRTVASALLRSHADETEHDCGDADGCTGAAALESSPRSGWVNPTEELRPATENLRLLATALAAAECEIPVDGCPPCDGGGDEGNDGRGGGDRGGMNAMADGDVGVELRVVDVARALCVGSALGAAAEALRYRSGCVAASGVGDAASREENGAVGRAAGGGLQLRAPLARVLRSALMADAARCAERDADDAASSVLGKRPLPRPPALTEALGRLRAAPGSCQFGIHEVINATCTGLALEQATAALRMGWRARLQRTLPAALSPGETAGADVWRCAAGHGAGCDCDQTCCVC